MDDARTKGFCQAFEIGRGKLKLVDPWWRSIGTFFSGGGVIVVVVVAAVVFSLS